MYLKTINVKEELGTHEVSTMAQVDTLLKSVDNAGSKLVLLDFNEIETVTMGFVTGLLAGLVVNGKIVEKVCIINYENRIPETILSVITNWVYYTEELEALKENFDSDKTSQLLADMFIKIKYSVAFKTLGGQVLKDTKWSVSPCGKYVENKVINTYMGLPRNVIVEYITIIDHSCSGNFGKVITNYIVQELGKTYKYSLTHHIQTNGATFPEGCYSITAGADYLIEPRIIYETPEEDRDCCII